MTEHATEKHTHHTSKAVGQPGYQNSSEQLAYQHSEVTQCRYGNQPKQRLHSSGVDNRAPVQRKEAPEHSSEQTQAPRPNHTGLPNRLKNGLEHMSGFDLSQVRVHYNSTKPAQLGALAYTQGQNIYVGRNQEKHLPHEGWHVVQQMQGQVRPTVQMKGEQVNDDGGLEKEADVMGGKCNTPCHFNEKHLRSKSIAHATRNQRSDYIQRTTVMQFVRVTLSNGQILEVDDLWTTAKIQEVMREANVIVQRIKNEYGIKLDSGSGRKAIMKSYYGKPVKSFGKQRGLEKDTWTIDMLRALSDALGYYKDILGPARKFNEKAEYSGSPQNLSTFSMIDRALSPKWYGGTLERETYAETFRESSNISIFNLTKTDTLDFPQANNALEKQMRYTIAHELVHALLQAHILNEFEQEVVTTGERPITTYGATNNVEDMCESFAMYFVDPDRLKNGNPIGTNNSIPPTGQVGNPAPVRYAFCHKHAAKISSKLWQEREKIKLKKKREEMMKNLGFTDTEINSLL